MLVLEFHLKLDNFVQCSGLGFRLDLIFFHHSFFACNMPFQTRYNLTHIEHEDWNPTFFICLNVNMNFQGIGCYA